MAGRAIIYCRISRDRTGAGAGVERQLADCRELARSRGLEVACELSDNDISAYSGKPRPAYRRLIQLLDAGGIDAVLAWHPDRLHRSPTELEEFIALLERRGVRVETVQAGIWDLSTPSGRLVARQLGGVARYESEHRSARVRRALEQNAQAGRPHGRRPYGWRRERDPATSLSMDVIDADEAEVVRLIARMVCDGYALRAIAQQLNDSGRPAPSGGRWQKNLVRHLILRPRNVGLREHRGEVVGPGDWTPILEDETYARVQSILTDPLRRTSFSSSVRHLLSGIAVCGVCGSPVRASQNRGRASYRCKERGCVSRSQEQVDEFVTAVVLERLREPDVLTLLAAQPSGSVEKALGLANEKRVALDAAADAFAAGSIDVRQLERISIALRKELESLERNAADLLSRDVASGLERTDPDEWWLSLPLARRRAMIELLCRVTIEKSTPGQRTFEPREVRIDWRQNAS